MIKRFFRWLLRILGSKHRYPVHGKGGRISINGVEIAGITNWSLDIKPDDDTPKT